MLPIVLAVAGTLIAGLTSVLVAVLAWLGKFTLETITKRVDDASARVKATEEKVATHETKIATAHVESTRDATAMANVQREVEGVREKLDEELGDVRDKLAGLQERVVELLTLMKRGTPTPPRPIPRVDPDHHR